MSLLRHGCQRHSFLNSQIDIQMYTIPDEMNWQFVQILMDSKFQSKLRVLDTDDVKQKAFLFSVQGKSPWYCFKVFVLLFYMSSVSVTQNKCPNSHHSHPVHLFNKWISHECEVQNGWISWETLYLLVVWFLDTIFCQWNMFSFGEYAGICHLPLASWKKLHLISQTYTETPWLDLRGMINFPGMVTHVTH